jgi:predicted small secreted protein
MTLVDEPHAKIMKTRIKHTILLMLASSLVAVFSSGCGTVRGIGKDVGTVGEGIEKSAR